MTLLSLVNAAVAEAGLGTQFTSLVGNTTDANAAQLVALANRAGKEMAEDSRAAGYWQQLRKQYTLTTVGVGPYTCTITPGSQVLTNVSSVTGITIGQNVYASGLVNDTLVTAISTNTVTISQVPTSTVALNGQSVVFATEAYAFPSDLAYLIVQTEWDRSFRWQLLGPLNAQEWQVIKSGISPVGPRMRFRIMQGMLYVNPVGSASTVFHNTIAFEYVSKYWVANVINTTTGYSTYFQNDTDSPLISDDLLTLSVKWRFLQAKGLDYEAYKKEYEDKFDRIKGRDASSRNLPLNAQSRGMNLLGYQNIPDTSYGS